MAVLVTFCVYKVNILHDYKAQKIKKVSKLVKLIVSKFKLRVLVLLFEITEK